MGADLSNTTFHESSPDVLGSKDWSLKWFFVNLQTLKFPDLQPSIYLQSHYLWMMCSMHAQMLAIENFQITKSLKRSFIFFLIKTHDKHTAPESSKENFGHFQIIRKIFLSLTDTHSQKNSVLDHNT